MTYLELKSEINTAYALFTYNYVIRKTLGADNEYSERQVFFVKCIYKVLMNQSGDEDLDLLTEEDIQNTITLFNKFSGSKIQIEYT